MATTPNRSWVQRYNPNAKKAISKSNWETPWPLFDKIEALLDWTFTLDACANKSNRKCYDYISLEDSAARADGWINFDGLTSPWADYTFCNPPFGGGIEDWVKKADSEWVHAEHRSCLLLPDATDTNWAHQSLFPRFPIIILLWPRVQFVGSTTSNPTGSMLGIQGAPGSGSYLDQGKVYSWDWQTNGLYSIGGGIV